MNFSAQKFCLQLFRCCNTKKFFTVQRNHLLQTSTNRTVLITRTVIARPKELDQIRKTTKERKEEKHKYQNDDNAEEIGLYGYFLLSIPVITFGLGTWQVGRRQWKLELIKSMEERMAREPIELPENLDDLAKLEYCPIKVRGEFLYDKEFVVGPRSLIINGRGANEGKGQLISGSATSKGFNIITPFKLEDRNLTILVNRGWLPNKYKNANERKKTQIHGTLTITGVNRLNENRPQFSFKNDPESGIWHYKDLHEMSRYAGTEPIFLDLIDSLPGNDMPIAAQTRVNLRNEHLSYIITWYGISAFTGFYWYRIFILKKPIL